MLLGTANTDLHVVWFIFEFSRTGFIEPDMSNKLRLNTILFLVRHSGPKTLRLTNSATVDPNGQERQRQEVEGNMGWSYTESFVTDLQKGTLRPE